MAAALVKLKNRLNAFELEVCKFMVEKVYNQYPPSIAKITIILHPNTGNAHFDVIVNGKRYVHPIETVTSLRVSKNDPNKFYVGYKNGPVDVFTTKMREEVYTALRECLTHTAKH